MEEEIVEYDWKPVSELIDNLKNIKEDIIVFPYGTYMKFKFYTDDRTKYVEISDSSEPLEGELLLTSVCYKLIDDKLVIESFDDFVCEPEFLDKMEYAILKN